MSEPANREEKRIVIAGAGITGLSAAYYLHRFLSEEGRRARIIVVEKSGRTGGKISTWREDGFVVEQGPDSFLARKRAMIDLAFELGLRDELVPTNPQASKTYILRRGRPVPMPPGLVFGVPVRWKPLVKSELLSLPGKLRALMEPLVPVRREQTDESLGHFMVRRLGREAHDRIVEPLLSGIYAGDTHELSLLATYPQFAALERRYGSLVRGFLKTGGSLDGLMDKSGETGPASPANSNQASGGSTGTEELPERLRKSVFLSFRRGLGSIIEALEEKLKGHAEIVTGEAITAIIQQAGEPGSGRRCGYTVRTSGGRTIEADAVILTVPAFALADVLGDVPEVRSFAQMPHISVANVVFAYNAADIRHSLDASGILVPRREKRFITACTWTSSKWGHVAPEGRVLLRCYVGRSGEEQWTGLDDEQIMADVRRELQTLLGIDASPLFGQVNRLMRSMPQYRVGHLEQVARVRTALHERYPGVFATGASFEGIGLPDCIRQGKETAGQVAAWLR